MMLELLALGLVFWGGARLAPLSKLQRLSLLGLAALPLLQLLPLPGLSRLSLPGQGDYYSALQMADQAAMTTLSVLPRETLLGWLVLLVPIAIGLGPVWERFSARSPMDDGRWATFDGVWEGIAQFFPLGAGSGTFEQTFLPFQSLGQSMYTINQAHNSYLEWLYNGGVLALLVLLMFLACYALRWISLWRRGAWGDFRYIQVGAGLGMLLTLMHEAVDFNLFVPANMVYFAFFAGLFFYPYEEPKAAPRSRRRSSEPAERSKPLLQPVSDTPATNPFMGP